ncbi:hypothetical protein [Vibrio crassostreae]|uniref:hypothetical protein n=1 Tax=Vibrio crassostreae TaxID=246167 RepID=UPI001B30F137|nr:hypothetical protein [Vibrio crassostreae]
MPHYVGYDIGEQGRPAMEVLFTRTLYHFTQVYLVNNALIYKKEMRSFALANYRCIEDVPEELSWVRKTLEMAG